ncbi:hydrogenase iron-sulfur subunit [candidate division KSB1 bacterium]
MKVGLFFSRDNGIISETVDVDTLADAYSNLAVSKVYDSFFSYDDQLAILREVEENALEGVVLAGNSPKFYTSVFNGDFIIRELTKLGINENKIAFANIREQVAFPHRGENEIATEKARLFIEIALSRLEVCHDIESVAISPFRSVLIVGTNAGGLIAAKLLLDKKYKVYILEKWHSFQDLEGIEEDLTPTITAIQSDKNAKIFFETDIEDFFGWCGDFKITLSNLEEKVQITVGGVIVCVDDDFDKIEELRETMQIDTDMTGSLRGVRKKSYLGRTRDPGVWFLPYRKEVEDRYADEANSAGLAILAITTILDKGEIQHPVLISEVDESICGGCGTCVKTCAFSASSVDSIRKVAVIDSKRCKGCGNCVVACPTGARDLITFPEEYVFNAIDILSERIPKSTGPNILIILCNSCGYPAADLAGDLSLQKPELKYSANAMPVLVECGGNVDTQYVLYAFQKGFDGVAITICRNGHCHHIVGNTDMERRIGLFRAVLRSRNINDDRLRIIHVSPDEGQLFSEEINSFTEELKRCK